MNYRIREAINSDAPKILELLYTIAELHHNIYPEIFKPGKSKYSEEELFVKFKNPNEKIFVAADENDIVLGYIFCIVMEYKNNSVIFDHKTLYVDDLCVDENMRGKGIATSLMDSVMEYAKQIGCYDVSLNVWAGNVAAEHFYEKYGFKTQSRHMDIKLISS